MKRTLRALLCAGMTAALLCVPALAAEEAPIPAKQGDKRAAADRIMALMTLGVVQGDTVTIAVEGGDEERSLEQIRNYFENNL